MFAFFNPFDFNDPISYAVPGFVILVVTEWYLRRKRNMAPMDYGDAAASIGLGLGAVVIELGVKAVFIGVYLWLYQFRIFDNLGPATVEGFADINWHLAHWWVWVIVFFADDFTFYWHHRLSHEIRILWAAHINHHSSQQYNLATALRQSWTEYLYKNIWWIWMPLVGFHPLMIMTMSAINLIYQFWTHTELVGKLGFFEKIFNTASHHRVHHASDIKYLDKNYAGILIIWDKMFGTFQEEEETPNYGITSNIHTNNLLKITFHEVINIIHDVKKADKFTDKLKYIFYAPGWSADGNDQRAKTLQKKMLKNS